MTETVVLGDRILVGLVVSDAPTAKRRAEPAQRWQLLTVRDGLIVDIVGFEQRDEALAYPAATGGERSPG